MKNAEEMNAPPHMFKALVAASLISGSIAGCSNPLPPATATSRYVPGLSCNDVAGFAQNVATQRSQGVDLLDQFDAIEYNYSDNPQTIEALKGIARGIYRTDLKNESPSSVGTAYRRECALTDKTR